MDSRAGFELEVKVVVVDRDLLDQLPDQCIIVFVYFPTDLHHRLFQFHNLLSGAFLIIDIAVRGSDPPRPIIFSCIFLHSFKEGIADRIQMTSSLRYQ